MVIALLIAGCVSAPVIRVLYLKTRPSFLERHQARLQECLAQAMDDEAIAHCYLPSADP